MKNYILILFTLAIFLSTAQVDTTTANYEKGMHILKQTKKEIKSRNGEKHYIDYWNLALAATLLLNLILKVWILNKV